MHAVMWSPACLHSELGMRGAPEALQCIKQHAWLLICARTRVDMPVGRSDVLVRQALLAPLDRL